MLSWIPKASYFSLTKQLHLILVSEYSPDLFFKNYYRVNLFLHGTVHIHANVHTTKTKLKICWPTETGSLVENSDTQTDVHCFSVYVYTEKS